MKSQLSNIWMVDPFNIKIPFYDFSIISFFFIIRGVVLNVIYISKNLEQKLERLKIFDDLGHREDIKDALTQWVK